MARTLINAATTTDTSGAATGKRGTLRELAPAESSTYRDTYYDYPGRDLTTTGRELRLRIADTVGQRRSLPTYKEAAVDAGSGSKPEHETG